jgi:CIC family chloride channel protein
MRERAPFETLRPPGPKPGRQRITLAAAGAGIAATFNTPIGGVITAIAFMMPDVSTRTCLPVALATGTATSIGRTFLEIRPAFDAPAVGGISTDPRAASLLLPYAVPGAVICVASAAFRGLHYNEENFGEIENSFLRHASLIRSFA